MEFCYTSEDSSWNKEHENTWKTAEDIPKGWEVLIRNQLWTSYNTEKLNCHYYDKMDQVLKSFILKIVLMHVLECMWYKTLHVLLSYHSWQVWREICQQTWANSWKIPSLAISHTSQYLNSIFMCVCMCVCVYERCAKYHHALNYVFNKLNSIGFKEDLVITWTFLSLNSFSFAEYKHVNHIKKKFPIGSHHM